MTTKLALSVAALAFAGAANAATVSYNYGTPLAIAPIGGTDPVLPTITLAESGTITDLDVFVNGYSHDSWRDTDFVLTLLADDVSVESAVVLRGEGNLVFDAEAISGVDLVFDDEAGVDVPVSGLTSGSYRPTDYWDYVANETFGTLPIAADLSDFADGLDMTRSFGLYVFDYFQGNAGAFTDWGLTVTFDEAVAVPAPGFTLGFAAFLMGGALVRRRSAHRAETA
ncbi:MAG: hypothetical protein AAGD40_03415 [Pseudomonadota bacterium]